MEILKFLVSFFANQKEFEGFKPLFDCFLQGNMDFKSLLSKLDMQQVFQAISTFTSFANKNPQQNDFAGGVGLSPIIDLADDKVLKALNGYFCV
jgi:hypothetical protein